MDNTTNDSIRSKLYFWFVPVLLFLTDIIIRHDIILKFTSLEWFFYLLSFPYSILIYKALFSLLQLSRQSEKPAYRRFYFFILVGMTLFYTTSLAISYGVFLKMGLMPNYFTFEYLRMETYNTWTIIRDSFSLSAALIIFLLIGSISFSLHQAARSKQRLYAWKLPGKLVHGFLLIGLFFIFNNNVRFVDQCFISDVNAISFSGRNFYNLLFHKNLGSTGLQARNRILIPKTYANPGYNILFVIGESLRAKNLQLYGYPIPNTPFLCELSSSHPKETFVFKRHFSNSSATLLSYPGILNGISPAQSPRLFHASPLLFEYAKAAGYATFLITSHDYNFYNFRSFFNVPDIDYFWDKEKSGLPAVNDLGIEDSVTVNQAMSFLDSLRTRKKPLMGVVHLNTNHYPYHTPEKYTKWHGTAQNSYDNTILYQDDLLKRIFTVLKDRGLSENTIVIFVPDHGEGFGEHQFTGHRGFYFIELLHIPLIFYIPEPLQNHFQVELLERNANLNTNNIDLVPTFLDLINIHDDDFITKLRRNFMGQSLLRPLDSVRTIVVANNNPIARYQEGMSAIRGHEHYLYQLNARPNKESLYDLEKDPEEKQDLWPSLTTPHKESFRDIFRVYPSLNELLK